jgi:tetratricopeptide (TPR) repeat protein
MRVPPPPAARRRLIVAALIALAVLAAFSPAIFNDFVNYDDRENLYANPMVNRGLTLEGVRWAFTISEFPNWHPLTWISHMADFSLFGTWAGGHHLVSLLLHAANAAALALLLRAATGALAPAALVAALFALHPLRVESVAWAAERKDVLTVFFGLLALAAWLRWVRRRSAGALAASLALYACALMAKPMLVTLPALLLLLDYWPLGRWGVPGRPAAARPLALLLEKAPYLALAAASSVVTLVAQRGGGAVAYVVDYPVPQRVANAFRSYGVYLAKTLWPAKLAVFYPYFWDDVPWWQPALGAAVVVAGSVAALALARRRPAVFVGWYWYLVSLLPVIGIVQAGSQALADRYTYVPHVGVFLALVALAGGALARRPRLRGPAAAAALAVLAALGAATARQTTLWRSSETLFRHAIAVTKDNFIAYSNLGTALSLSGRTAEGNALIARSFKTNPYFRGEVLTRSGDYFVRQGQFGEAADQYRRALALAPHDTRLAEKLRDAERRAGGPARAPAAAPNPHAGATAAPGGASGAGAAFGRGNALIQAGRRAEAVAAYREAVRLDPALAEAWGNLGAALGELGRLDEAERALREAVRLAPGMQPATGNLAAVRALRAQVSR